MLADVQARGGNRQISKTGKLMDKEKMDIRGMFTHNFWLKLISLLIAIIIWLYVNGEITKRLSL